MSDMLEVRLYYANWCPHCVSFKDTWNQFKEKMGDKIKITEYEDEELKKGNLPTNVLDDKENYFDGFPTVLYIRGNNVEKFEEQRTLENLIAKTGIQLGGAKGEEYYKMKYFKYKAKYLKLLAKQ